MQYKIVLSAVLFTLGVLPSQAQQQGVTAKNPALKSDTVTIQISKPAANVSSTLLASNLPSERTKDSSKYRHVPLAGEKAYFGDKNDFVNEYVRKYLERNNQTLGSVQNNSTKPFSVIDNVLEKKSLPKELKYLAVIESALNHKAVSHAGAVGPWQLMESTARMMGLTVSRRNDERTDWYKSTTAATKYLELLYGQLNDWLLVIAAYNSGPVPVQKAIDRTGSRNFWDIKEYLPRETQGHVLAFIATASIFENMSKFISLGTVPVDFKFGKEEEPGLVLPKNPAAIKNPVAAITAPVGGAATATVAATAGSTPAANFIKKPSYTEEEIKLMTIVRITEPLHLELLATEMGVDKRLLERWNSDYDLFVYSKYPTPFYNLRIPKDKLDAFLQKKDAVSKKSKIIFAQIKK